MMYYRNCPECSEVISYKRLVNFNNSIKKNKSCQRCASMNGRIIYLTKDKCAELALLCKTRKELNVKYSGAYNKILKNRWDDELCKHMIRVGNSYMRCVYAYEFNDDYIYVGLTCNINNRDYAHKHTDKNSSVYKHIKKTKYIPEIHQLSEYIPKEKAANLECEFIKKYNNDGWKILNKNKGGTLGGIDLFWTEKNCLDAAKKCKSRKEFILRFPGAWCSAKKYGWLKKCYKHMILLMKPQGFWTKNRCLEIALKCNSKKQFRNKNISAYNIANRKQWMQDICKHMIQTHTQKGYWTKERCRKIASKYINRTLFHSEEAGAFKACRKNGWINEFFPKKYTFQRQQKHKKYV